MSTRVVSNILCLILLVTYEAFAVTRWLAEYWQLAPDRFTKCLFIFFLFFSFFVWFFCRFFAGVFLRLPLSFPHIVCKRARARVSLLFIHRGIIIIIQFEWFYLVLCARIKYSRFWHECGYSFGKVCICLLECNSIGRSTFDGTEATLRSSCNRETGSDFHCCCCCCWVSRLITFTQQYFICLLASLFLCTFFFRSNRSLIPVDFLMAFVCGASPSNIGCVRGRSLAHNGIAVCVCVCFEFHFIICVLIDVVVMCAHFVFHRVINIAYIIIFFFFFVSRSFVINEAIAHKREASELWDVNRIDIKIRIDF